jgi:hypothetical protein
VHDRVTQEGGRRRGEELLVMELRRLARLFRRAVARAALALEHGRATLGAPGSLWLR